MDFIQHQLDRRRPGQSQITTRWQRASDHVEFHSGVYQGKTTGTPIGFYGPEHQSALFRSQQYGGSVSALLTPDYTYYNKYGLRDPRGGGCLSARITISRCVGGALAMLALRHWASPSVPLPYCWWHQVARHHTHYDLLQIDSNIVRCPDQEKARRDGSLDQRGQSRRRHRSGEDRLCHQRLSCGTWRTGV